MTTLRIPFTENNRTLSLNVLGNIQFTDFIAEKSAETAFRSSLTQVLPRLQDSGPISLEIGSVLYG